MFRASGAFDGSILYGDSDTDQFVHDLPSGKFRIIGKGTPDVVFEEFDTMDELLAGIVRQIEESV